MADLTDAKQGTGDTFLTGTKETEFLRTEPLISPTELRDQFLWGLILISGLKDPITKRAQKMTDPMLAKFIDRAVAIAEAETGLVFFPTIFEERQAFDLNQYKSWGYLKTEKRPVKCLIQLSVAGSNEVDLFDIPLDWVEVGRLHVGQINIQPLTSAILTSPSENPTTTTVVSPYMLYQVFGLQWIPALWTIRYQAGFDNGAVPKIANELIGIIAALLVLNALANTFGRITSASLSLDGGSQSTSGPGNQIYAVAIADLEERRDRMIKKLKNMYGTSFFSDAL